MHKAKQRSNIKSLTSITSLDESFTFTQFCISSATDQITGYIISTTFFLLFNVWIPFRFECSQQNERKKSARHCQKELRMLWIVFYQSIFHNENIVGQSKNLKWYSFCLGLDKTNLSKFIQSTKMLPSKLTYSKVGSFYPKLQAFLFLPLPFILIRTFDMYFWCCPFFIWFMDYKKSQNEIFAQKFRHQKGNKHNSTDIITSIYFHKKKKKKKNS